MATIEQYQAVAPTIMSVGNFTTEQIETKLGAVPEVDEDAQPLTKTKIVKVFNAVFSAPTPEEGINLSGGIAAVAANAGLSKKQVKTIARELVAMKRLYQSNQ